MKQVKKARRAKRLQEARDLTETLHQSWLQEIQAKVIRDLGAE
jgi:hypothetical protein